MIDSSHPKPPPSGPADGARPALSLFDDVVAVYAGAGGQPLTNSELYRRVRERRPDLPSALWDDPQPVGREARPHRIAPRHVRWQQQTLAGLGLLERESRVGRRGVWRLSAQGRDKLVRQQPGRVMLAYSTDLGLAFWADARDAFRSWSEPIDLVFTSLPYMLRCPRAYGAPGQSDRHAGAASDDEYVDWACSVIEPLMRALKPSGSVVINVGADTFEPGLPSRRLIPQRLTIALVERLGLHLMDSLTWHKTSAPPGPVLWASRTRQQLNAAQEPLLWLSPDPLRCAADNRRVLKPHTQRHLALVAAGGEQRTTSYGGQRLTPGAFAGETAGAIARNVLPFGQRCQDKHRLGEIARAAGLPVHDATMPTSLAQFIVEFMTDADGLAVDTCAGWNTLGRACEASGRRWASSEIMDKHVATSALGFVGAPGFRSRMRWAASPHASR